MKHLLFSLFFILCSFRNVTGQVSIETVDQAKLYLIDEWTLIKYCAGWAGCDDYPNDSVDYTLKLMNVSNNSNQLSYHFLKNDIILQSDTIFIQFVENDNYNSWLLDNFPCINNFWSGFPYMGIENTLDTLGLNDQTFDGSTFYYKRKNTSYDLGIFTPDSTPFAYPNPVASKDLCLDYKEATNIELYDINGLFIRQLELSKLHNCFDVTDLTNGTYFIRFQNHQKIQSIKFIKI